MRVIRSLEEFDDRDLTVEVKEHTLSVRGDEIKEAIARAQASLEEHTRLGDLGQAQAAYEARDNLLLALAARLSPA